MTRLQQILLVVLAVALAAIGFGVYQQAGGDDLSGRSVKIGQSAPGYAAKTLDGETVRLSEFEGKKAVLLNIWATWCEPCREEMPKLQKLYEEYQDDGLVVVGVSVDSKGQEESIRQFVKSVGVTFPILHDPDKRVVPTFQTIGTPESILINKSGEIDYRWRGEFDPQSDNAQAIIKNTLGLTAGPIDIEAENVYLLAAFLAGLLAAFSPCFSR